MKGILFKPQLIPLVLSGKKTMTRRVIKPQPFEFDKVQAVPGVTPQHYPSVQVGKARYAYVNIYEWKKVEHGEQSEEVNQYAHYHPGEIIYVKEKWGIAADLPVSYHKDEFIVKGGGYLAYSGGNRNTAVIWKSPLMMPEWASRCKLKILNVGVEQLQEITEEDAIIEGVLSSDYDKTYRYAFSMLWDSINKKHPWSSNPWVFVYEWEVNHVAR
jgi:hypothetical protein